MEELWHYTSRHLAQEIAISKKLKPGRGGKLYLTPDRYEVGYLAAAHLAILKCVAAACLIPKERVRELSDEGLVEPFLGPAGEVRRPGGGTEVWTTQEIELPGKTYWIPLDLP